MAQVQLRPMEQYLVEKIGEVIIDVMTFDGGLQNVIGQTTNATLITFCETLRNVLFEVIEDLSDYQTTLLNGGGIDRNFAARFEPKFLTIQTILNDMTNSNTLEMFRTRNALLWSVIQERANQTIASLRTIAPAPPSGQRDRPHMETSIDAKVVSTVPTVISNCLNS